MFSKKLFGQRILEQRKKQKKTQQDLANLLGVGKSHISEIEHGNRTTTAEKLRRFVIILRFQPTICWACPTTRSLESKRLFRCAVLPFGFTLIRHASRATFPREGEGFGHWHSPHCTVVSIGAVISLPPWRGKVARRSRDG